jgi:hypothetical protein
MRSAAEACAAAAARAHTAAQARAASRSPLIRTPVNVGIFYTPLRHK